MLVRPGYRRASRGQKQYEVIKHHNDHGAVINARADQELMILEHLILSHHGRLEFGAAVMPMTLEAEILHYADNASAKTASMSDALRDPENFPDGGLLSARGIWTLDRRKAWRGTSDWGEGSSALRLVADE